MRVRIEDVAARADVSPATVSLVLRDRPGPSAATRARVRGAAEALGYRADRTASLLARHRSGLLGVVLDVTSAFHSELITALDGAAARRGFDLVLSTITPRRGELDAAETLLDFRCEGLVLLGPVSSRPELEALAARCPTVVVGRAGTGGAVGVRAADERGLELAVEHLTGQGHRRIAYVEGPRGRIATVRRKGYRAAMTRHGLGAGIELLAGGQTEESGVRAAEAVLRRPPPDRPSAVICFNDRSAIGLRDTLLRAGVTVPEEVSVVGYDDSPPARLGTIDLTTVSQDPAALADATIEALAALVDRAARQRRGAVAEPAAGDLDLRDAVISPRLIIRSSTGPPAPNPLQHPMKGRTP